MGAGNYYFVIVGPNDKPVFEFEFGQHAQGQASGKVDQTRH